MSNLTSIYGATTNELLAGIKIIIGDLDATPEQRATIYSKMDTLTQTSMIRLKDLETQREKQYQNDMEAARNSDKFVRRFPFILALIVVVVVLVFDILMFFIEIPNQNRDMVIQTSGVLNTGGFIMIISYFFRSTAASQMKNETIKNMSGKDEVTTRSQSTKDEKTSSQSESIKST